MSKKKKKSSHDASSFLYSTFEEASDWRLNNEREDSTEKVTYRLLCVNLCVWGRECKILCTDGYFFSAITSSSYLTSNTSTYINRQHHKNTIYQLPALQRHQYMITLMSFTFTCSVLVYSITSITLLYTLRVGGLAPHLWPHLDIHSLKVMSSSRVK